MSRYDDAKNSLIQELFERLGREPTDLEVDQECSEERIVDRIAYWNDEGPEACEIYDEAV